MLQYRVGNVIPHHGKTVAYQHLLKKYSQENVRLSQQYLELCDELFIICNEHGVFSSVPQWYHMTKATGRVSELLYETSAHEAQGSCLRSMHALNKIYREALNQFLS